MTGKLFGRIVKIQVSGDYKAEFTSSELHIEFEVPFDDDEKPNETSVMIYNLSQNSISRIKKGSSLTVQAGYKSDYGVLAQGEISHFFTRREGVDKVTTIKMLEGEDLAKKKTAKPITFKAGTKADVIIKRLASVLGFKLLELKLPKNVIYKKGYTVTGNIENNLIEVVKDCGASMYNRRGGRVIRSIKEGTVEHFRLEDSTGLLQSPEPFDEDGVRGYNVMSLLQHRITVASIIEIESKTANGKYRVKKGKHLCNGDEFRTEMKVI
ncbi:phage protein [Mesobacillus zeae]|uniref:Uncharacterized protein n=1 Tax=Mesobacillus zeae TaxID=1917180 RepID=A0A398BBE4_9BACI|nr:hypothetical protein [Mesobacillus zeae]RID85016.1 hypothetical protein D1970_10640 [Mesobacillus zeae]